MLFFMKGKQIGVGVMVAMIIEIVMGAIELIVYVTKIIMEHTKGNLHLIGLCAEPRATGAALVGGTRHGH
jgi:hypothetical protein